MVPSQPEPNSAQTYHNEFFASAPEEGVPGYCFGTEGEAQKVYSFGRYRNDGVNVLKFPDGAITVEYIPTGKVLSFDPENAEAGWSWARQRAKHCKRISFHF